MSKYSKGTICVQGGYKPKVGEARILPICQSTTFKYDDPDHLADLFDLKVSGHFYSRVSNPTLEGFEAKFNELEGGVGAVAVSSGQSAILLAVLNLCSSGDNIISTSNLYGGTFNLFNINLKKLGIETKFISPEATKEEILALVDDNTKLFYGEIIGNPSINILDLDKFSELSKASGVPLIVDSTIATPYLCRPFEYGAAIVVHSTTKYSDGHAAAVGGIIVDSGNFDWNNGRFPELVKPDPSYHGIKYVEKFAKAAYITKLRVTLLRDFGCVMSPQNAFLTNLGLETLHLRMERHSSNALALARYLQKHEKVSWVRYPLLETQKDFERAKSLLPKGGSGMLTFGIKGGVQVAKTFTKALKLTALVVHIGDARTSILHPASTTHSQLTEEEQIASGVSADLIRISVGIEDADDIIKDFEQAFNTIGE
ncbi:O-acetylhomoserine aminocarboxypropyltransferase/cysteine synthase family protein [uncultured Clostridium sp.]|jgi:O-acetylhomoserine (thiol)-lyase|uniref:O-acetylhomoserine aminocarboxypropyltransferase/cysteine synthase family protein n=1 Tax=uncultured Clostridium sp. TaxID=59620 RepID=UPI0026245C95|nr:O-acetylhomoserine aminocarboxypropyltransferase/cysteine synthase family protein [uncultured Clostridium sp.]